MTVNGYHSVEQIKGIIGYQMLSWAARAESIKRDDFNWSANGHWSLIDSLLRAGLIRQATLNNDLEELEAYHRSFWQSERGFRYHNSWQPAIMEIFLKHYTPLVTDIATMLKASPNYLTVCEIGTGTGYLLEYLAEQLPSVDRFIGIDEVMPTLPLHNVKENEEYYLGVFLVGAYQETLGDLHNLFGDTNAVHVELSDTGEVILDTLLKGETVREVLDYVQFNDRDLVHRLQLSAETAIRAGRLDHTEAGRFVKFFEEALNGYTYLKKPPTE